MKLNIINVSPERTKVFIDCSSILEILELEVKNQDFHFLLVSEILRKQINLNCTDVIIYLALLF